MIKRWGFVAFLLAIAILCLYAAWVLSDLEVLSALLGVPAVISLLGVIFKVFEQEAKFLKDKWLKDRQQVFELGAASHMANVIFDKHVAFCESYLERIDLIVLGIMRDGISGEIRTHLDKCLRLREQYTAWIPDQSDRRLAELESVLRGADANRQFLEDSDNVAGLDEKRARLSDNFNRILADLLASKEGDKAGRNILYEIKNEIRIILQIENLLVLRTQILDHAKSGYK